MPDSPFSANHRSRFSQLLRDGEVYALNFHPEHLSIGPWSIVSSLPDTEAAERLQNRFRNAARMAALSAGAPPRVSLCDWWVNRLVGDQKVLRLQNLVQKSVELCQELEDNSVELGAPIVHHDVVAGLHRDLYPIDLISPHQLYDHARDPSGDPKADFDYWLEHIWSGFWTLIRSQEAGRNRERNGIILCKRQEHETRRVFRARVQERVEETYRTLRYLFRSLAYDLAVLLANYTIDRGSSGDDAVRVFDLESLDALGRMQEAWKESSRRLGLSWRKQQRKGIDFTTSMRSVRSDLRRLLNGTNPVDSTFEKKGRISGNDKSGGAFRKLSIEQENAAAEEAFKVLQRQPEWMRVQERIARANLRRSRKDIELRDTPSRRREALRHFSCQAMTYLALVVDSTTTNAFCSLLPLFTREAYIFSCGFPPQAARPVSKDSHEFDHKIEFRFWRWTTKAYRRAQMFGSKVIEGMNHPLDPTVARQERLRQGRRDAEAVLKQAIEFHPYSENFRAYIPRFSTFAVALFRSEAEELLGEPAADSAKVRSLLEADLPVRIVDSILPDMSLEAAKANTPGFSQEKATPHECNSEGIWGATEGDDQDRVAVPRAVQVLYAFHGYWERYAPNHVRFELRMPAASELVRQVLSQDLLRESIFWVGRLPASPPMASDSPGQSPDSEHPPKKKRGRPTKIADKLKIEALQATGNKLRAQILYQTKYPTQQQVRNVPSILRHFTTRSDAPKG
jgi:hypothetical protein